MRSINRVTIVGRLGKDVEIKQFGERRIALASVATEESWQDKQSQEWKKKTDWHNLLFQGKLVDEAAQLRKGMQILVDGRLSNSEYTDKTGVKRVNTQVIVNSLSRMHSEESPPKNGSNSYKQGSMEIVDDVIPF